MIRLLFAIFAAGAVAGTTPAVAGCALHQVAELKVVMGGARRLRPVVEGTLDGQPVRLIVDTGGGGTVLTRAAFDRLKLGGPLNPVQMRSYGQSFSGVVAQAEELDIGGVRWMRPRFFVIDGDAGAGADGYLGEDFLAGRDLEFDLAHGVVRLFSPAACRGQGLAYWAAGAPVTELRLDGFGDAGRPFAEIEVNGAPLRAMFDSGSATSSMTADAAGRAGVHPGDPGVTPMDPSYGLGPAGLATWRGVFRTLVIGREVLGDVSLDFMDKPHASADVLLGADYFVTHRVLFSRAQGRLYATPVGAGGLRNGEQPNGR